VTDFILINIVRQLHGGKSWMDEGFYLSEALKIIPNRFLLVRIISGRIQQLKKGARPLVDVDDSSSLSSLEIACKEICQGKLKLEKVTQETKKIKKKNEAHEI
jgi:DNA-directed RNA polymerase subunit K/omega